jgi:ATP adenylyltransferase
MEYIRSLDDDAAEPGGCFLCRYLAQPEADALNHVVWREPDVFVVMNRFPYTNGHLLIAPARHVGEPADMTEAEMTALGRATYRGVALLKKALQPQGFNIGANLGRCAGAGLPEHIHHHVVARWAGDTNYMAVLGGIRVIPDALNATYALLVHAAREMGLRD